MKTKTALALASLVLAAAAAQAAGHPFGQAYEGKLPAADGVTNAAASAPTAATLRGFWKGEAENPDAGLDNFSARFEAGFNADGTFESRSHAFEASLYDNAVLQRRDHWLGTWRLQGDSILLNVKVCLMHVENAALEACSYLAETDSVFVYKAGIASRKGAAKALAFSEPFAPVRMTAAEGRFEIPSLVDLLAGAAAPQPRDRSWALALGESDVVHAEPERLERDYIGRRPAALSSLDLRATAH